MTATGRRIGLEQEFFLVDASGELSHCADEFLERCHQSALEQGIHPQYFVPEFVKNVVEINTPPAFTVEELSGEYLKHLHLAIATAKSLGLQLYPLSSYPLPIRPIMRNKTNYHAQVRTVGFDRSLHAGKCTGTHLHLELPPGILDPQVGVSYHSTPVEQAELLNIYNLATALDAAMIGLSRACPFYEGQSLGLANHVVHYRGSEVFGWDGVFTDVPIAGGLRPYADSVETLVELQFERHYGWLKAMDRAGVDRALFLGTGGNLLESSWNPIRLNQLGTVEIRSIDSTYPEVVIALAALLDSAARRVRTEHLMVRPVSGTVTFEVQGDVLQVPDFDFLNHTLLYAAVTEGIHHPHVNAYVESIFDFVSKDAVTNRFLARLRSDFDQRQTVESEILKDFAPDSTELSRGAGLWLVQQSCDRLEQKVSELLAEQLLAVSAT
jgi:hypothetical protein